MKNIPFAMAAWAAASLLAACAGRGVTPPAAGANPASPMLQRTAAAPQALVQSDGGTGAFNRPGNVLIADQFNNRVIEVDPASHKVVWSYTGVLGTNDAERIGSFTLMAGTGVPAANPPFEPQCASGCPDNRVLVVDRMGHTVWQYGTFGVTGSGFDQLNTPVQNTALPNGDVLITDQGNQRIIEVNRSKQIVFQYGTTGVSGIGPDELNNPNSAELLPNGHILIADEANNRVIEITYQKQIVWQYPLPLDPSKLNGAAFASRLPNGNTLITDSNNNRVIEVAAAGNLVWKFSTLAPGGNSAPLPTRAVRLRGGDTLISDQFNDRVILVEKAGPMGGHVVWQQGALNRPGIGFDHLNAPYDAKVVGDYTGLTLPTAVP